MIVCPKCGNQIPAETKFCKFCGSAISQTQPQMSAPSNVQRPAQSNVQRPVQSDMQMPARNNIQQPAPQKKKKTSKAVMAVIAVLLIIAIAAGGWLLWDIISEKKKENLSVEVNLTQFIEETIV